MKKLLPPHCLALISCATLFALSVADRANSQQPPPVPTINITFPADNATFANSTIVKGKVSSNQTDEQFKYTLENTYNRNGDFITNTREVTTSTDGSGNWEDSSGLHVFGTGNWKIDVELIATPSVKDHHDGTVSAL